MTQLRAFVGGMNVPVRGGAGRMNATIPLASLVIDEDAVTLAPRWFAAAMVGPFRAPLVWHIWIAIVWVVRLISSFRLWRSSRDTG